MANKLDTTLAAVNGGLHESILTGKSPVYEYKDGKKVSEIPIAYKATAALLGNRLTTLSVKIEGGADPLPKITEEQIDAACRGDNGVDFIYVTFKDATVSLYSIGGQMVMSGRASGVELVNSGK